MIYINHGFIYVKNIFRFKKLGIIEVSSLTLNNV